MEYQTKRRNLEEKKWKSGYRKYVIGYGRGRLVGTMERRRDSTDNKKRRRTRNERLSRNNNYAIDVQDLHSDIS